MAAVVLAIHAIFLLVVTLSFPHESSAATKTETVGGFTTRLFHIDSPLSPFYNPNKTSYDRAAEAAERSISRLHYFQAMMSSVAASTDAIRSPIRPSNGDYIMNISIGTPPLEITGIADTGSDLVWTECMPCEECYSQAAAQYDPSKSSTFSKVSCSDNLCKSMEAPPNNFKCAASDTCQYEMTYADESFSDGDVSRETFSFFTTDAKPPVSVPNMIFGCGRNSTGTYREEEGGIFGLGRGPLSLVSQLGSLAQGKFSYCLVPNNDETSGSQLVFGDRAVISYDDATPMIQAQRRETLYFLNLNDIIVGDVKLNLTPGIFHLQPNGNGGMMIDSGTALTLLQKDGYSVFHTVLKSMIKGEVVDPFGPYKLCYRGTSTNLVGFPQITFQFEGATLVLSPYNALQQALPNVVCLAIIPSDLADGLSILGNIAQQNFNVGYDLAGQKITFAPADCATF